MSERLCVSCDEPINPKRLKIMPHAVACVECINSGDVDDVFMYRSSVSQDEMGNFHVEMIKDKRSWDSQRVNDES